MRRTAVAVGVTLSVVLGCCLADCGPFLHDVQRDECRSSCGFGSCPKCDGYDQHGNPCNVAIDAPSCAHSQPRPACDCAAPHPAPCETSSEWVCATGCCADRASAGDRYPEPPVSLGIDLCIGFGTACPKADGGRR